MTYVSNPKTPIDFKTKFERASRSTTNTLTREDLKKAEDEQKLVEEKLAQVKKQRKPINFFNEPALKLLAKTPTQILSELGVRAFSGSRDVPKDDEKAQGLF